MKVLIVVDMQNDFIDGALGTPEAVAIVPNVKKKIAEYVENGNEIVFTQDTHFSDYLETHEGSLLPVPHCILNSHGFEIPKDINIESCDHICKYAFGWNWGLTKEDSYPDWYDIEIIGLCTDVCVISNALILRSVYKGADITVDASCCAGTTPERHKAALEVMKSCQINIIGE
jgi:nicotinamidase-related amidase